jgi:hypothetical protein
MKNIMNSSLSLSQNKIKLAFIAASASLLLSACGGNEHTGVSGSANPSPSPSSCPGQCFASGFAASITTQNGSLGNYAYVNSTYNGVDPNGTYWYGGVAPSTPPGSSPYPYMGIFAAAPGVTAASGNDTGTPLVVTASNIKLGISIGQEVWTSTNGTAQVRIVLQGKGNKYSYGGSSNCTALIYKDVTLTGQSMTNYIFPLSGFTVGYTVGAGSVAAATSCGQSLLSTPAAVVADGVAELHLQLLGASNMNTTVPATSGSYPSGLTFGAPIYFQ